MLIKGCFTNYTKLTTLIWSKYFFLKKSIFRHVALLRIWRSSHTPKSLQICKWKKVLKNSGVVEEGRELLFTFENIITAIYIMILDFCIIICDNMWFAKLCPQTHVATCLLFTFSIFYSLLLAFIHLLGPSS